MRLEWHSVNLERRFVEVPAAKSKTASRRLVALCDAALAWLTLVSEKTGRVVPYMEENKAIAGMIDAATRLRREREDLGAAPAHAKPPRGTLFRWVRNGLRHSFCSYRLAEVKDAARVALEAGNSPGILFRHYRELSARRPVDVVARLAGLTWRRSEFCRGWLITDHTGSGKTTSGINQLAHQVFRNELFWGGLCIDEKGVYWETFPRWPGNINWRAT
jgi:hypothetical protein